MWIYLWGEKQYKEELKGVEDVRKEKIKLKEELEEMKFKKRLEQEEIVHLQKINEERLKQNLETEKTKLLKEKNEEMLNFRKQVIGQIEDSNKKHMEDILSMNKELHAKMETRFNTELGNLKEIYSELMKRLPTITMGITKKM